MKIITMATLKGGAGKTMNAFNIGGILAERKKVLFIDIDPQCNLSADCGIDISDSACTFAEKNAILNGFQDLVHPPVDFFLGHLPVFQAEFHVFAHRHMGEYGVILEHHADIALGGGDVVDHLGIEGDGAPFDAVKARHHAKQGGFAAAGRAQQGEKFPFLYLQ